MFTPGTCVCVESLQVCLTLCDPMNCSLPGSSVHGILQSRILDWVAMPTSRGSSQPRDQTHISCVSCFADGVFTVNTTREALKSGIYSYRFIHTSLSLSFASFLDLVLELSMFH